MPAVRVAPAMAAAAIRSVWMSESGESAGMRGSTMALRHVDTDSFQDRSVRNTSEASTRTASG